jgi:hypothetical protein
MRNISIRNVFGTYRFYGVSFTHHNIFPGEPSRFEGVYVENVFCTKMPQDPPVDRRFIDSIDNAYGKGTHAWAIDTAPIIWFAEGVTCGTVVLSNIHRIEYAKTSAPTVQIDGNVKIDSLCIRNAYQKFINCEEVPLVVNKGTANIVIQ